MTNPVDVGRAVISSCISPRRLPGQKGWPMLPQQRRSRPQPEPQAIPHSCVAGPELRRRAGCFRLLAPFDSQLVLCQGSELLAEFPDWDTSGVQGLFTSLDSTQGCQTSAFRWTPSSPSIRQAPLTELRPQICSFADASLSSARTTPPLLALPMTWQL